MNIISKFLLIIFLFLLFQTKSYSQASADSTEITIDSVITKTNPNALNKFFKLNIFILLE